MTKRGDEVCYFWQGMSGDEPLCKLGIPDCPSYGCVHYTPGDEEAPIAEVLRLLSSGEVYTEDELNSFLELKRRRRG